MSVGLNPVLARELKERVRGLRAFLTIGLFLALLTATVWFVYIGNRADTFGFDLERQTRLGRDLFEWLLSIMLVLLLFLLPGLTAGAIAGERERQTLLPLQITPLTPRSILWGKVTAALAFLVLMIVAALPLFAVAYQLGGLAVLDIVQGLVAVVAVGVLVAAMVVAISTFAKRVQTATLLAYGFTALLAFGAPLAYGAVALVDASRGSDEATAPAILLAPNPVVFVATATAGENIRVGDTPLRALREGISEAHSRNGGWFAAPDRDARFDNVADDVFIAVEQSGLPARAWLISLGMLTALAAALFVLATRRLRIPSETER